MYKKGWSNFCAANWLNDYNDCMQMAGRGTLSLLHPNRYQVKAVVQTLTTK